MGFILAAAGSAVGLGNIWKFPYITGENGGGLFVLIYLVCIAAVGLPIMMAEIMIGRAAQKQPVVAFEVLAGRKTSWSMLGWLGVMAGFVILSYYVVVAGWAMDYALKSVVNFTEPIHDAAQLQASRYRATTPLPKMRQTLASARSQRETRSPIADLKRELPKSAWKDHQRFNQAVKGLSGPRLAQARAALFEDPRLKANALRVEAINVKIAALKARAGKQATVHYAGRSERQIRDEAETEKRREVVAARVQATFLELARDGWTSTFWAAIFMLITILIVAAGVTKGIERACTVLMPTLLVLIGVMVIYGMFQRGFGDAISFVFKPDPSKLKASGMLEALGHAFFTLSLGMGAMITYGSYQRGNKGLAGTAATIAGLDTLVALLACLMIFPITFSYGQAPSAGPGLVFMSMPLAFTEMGGGGMLLAILFFGLLVMAALTSAISLLEVVSSYFIDKRGWSRAKAAWSMGLAIFALAVPCAFSMDPDFKLVSWESTFGKNFFDTLDYLASNWMLPLGGLLVALYAGWVMPKKIRASELTGSSATLITAWLLLIRFVAPILVVLVLLQKVGLLNVDELLY